MAPRGFMVEGRLGPEGFWSRFSEWRKHQRRGWLWGAALLLLGVVAGAATIKPIIRSKARSAAAERGVLLAVDDVALGWREVTLREVSVSLRDVAVFRGGIQRVTVEFGWDLRPTRIDVVGGEVSFLGSPSKIREELERWRSARHGGSSESKGSTAPLLSVADLDISWQPGQSAPKAAELSGVSLMRTDTGSELVKVATAKLEQPGFVLLVDQGALELERKEGKRVLSQLQAGKVEAELDLEALIAVRKAPAAKGTAGTHSSPESEASRLASMLPALDADRGTELRGTIGTLVQQVADKLPVGSKVDLRKLSVNLEHEGEKLHLGPNSFMLDRLSDRINLQLSPNSQSQASPVALKLGVPLKQGAISLSLSGGPVSLAALGIKEGDFSLHEVGRSELKLASEATLEDGGKVLALLLQGRLSPLSFRNKALADSLLRGGALSWSGKARVLLDGSRYQIERLELGLGDVKMTLEGVIEKRGQHVAAELSGGVPLASCQSLLESAPEGLLPLLRGLRFSGTFALDAAVVFDTAKLSNMRVSWDFKNECRVTHVPVELSPKRFLNPFRMQVKDVTGRIVSIETGPGTPGWTPYGDISPHMETAVLICEDGRFFRHQGFDREAIENSIKENVKAGRFARGASTISMQLAKNLYLSFDKTLARKLQEAVLTTLLEQELSKQEMMELYLNVIEYGPGIYGIGEAARHYFNKSPMELELSQALYLASILPNPAGQHFKEDGRLGQGWQKYLRRLMRIAVKIGRLSEAEYEAALLEEVRFGEASVLPDGGMFLPAPDSDSDLDTTDRRQQPFIGEPDEGL